MRYDLGRAHRLILFLTRRKISRVKSHISVEHISLGKEVKLWQNSVQYQVKSKTHRSTKNGLLSKSSVSFSPIALFSL